jgi:hypothetical protein
MRDYECANAKLSVTLGFVPRRSVLEAVSDMLLRIPVDGRAALSNPRCYNIRWMEQLAEDSSVLDPSPGVL